MLTTLTIAAMLSGAPSESGATTGPDVMPMATEPSGDTGYVAGSSLADLNGDGVVDSFDLMLFVRCWYAGLPCADVNADGVVDLTDAILFLNA
ncbi:MAG: hypothetical protein KDA28_06425 [Phycisphaerales bacterium]|nr:hypothetical protein [Phycisphaerales bacterium]